MELPSWKTEPSDAESSQQQQQQQHFSSPSFSLAAAAPPVSEMISMEMPPMGHLGQPHPPPHHQPQLSPGYDDHHDKKKRECESYFLIVYPRSMASLSASNFQYS